MRHSAGRKLIDEHFALMLRLLCYITSMLHYRPGSLLFTMPLAMHPPEKSRKSAETEAVPMQIIAQIINIFGHMLGGAFGLLHYVAYASQNFNDVTQADNNH